MKDAKKNHGLFVRGAGTCVTATNCKFTGNGMSGVAVLAQVRPFLSRHHPISVWLL